MSHFSVVVLFKTLQNFQAKLESLMAPYDENIEVDPYHKECWCVGNEASDYAYEKMKEIGIDIGSLREKFNKDVLPDGRRINSLKNDERLYSEEVEKLWQDKYVTQLKDNEEKYKKEHPLYNKPTSDCEECDGTGKLETIYNPESKWDWYRIGGRWAGAITNTDYGDTKGFNFGEGAEEIKMNSSLVKDYIDLILEGKSYTPFAIVTPDGEWHEKGNMGWFAIVSNKNDNWEKESVAILSRYKDHYAIMVDCHI